MSDASPAAQWPGRWRSVCAAVAVCVGVVVSLPLAAQTLRAPSASSASSAGGGLTALPGGVAPAVPAAVREADHVTAIVNSEPITASEVRARAANIERQLRTEGQTVPGREALLREVLELLIVEATQMQRATELGIRVEESAMDMAERSIAEQNQMDLETFRRRLVQEGIDRTRFLAQVRRDITLQRLREREVEATVRVTDRDIDEFLQNEPAPAVAASPEQIHLGHILVSLRENAPPDEVASRLARALRASEKAAAGEDFATVAREFSDGPERAQGGAMGLRTPDRLPELFVQATRDLPVGGVSAPVRSGAGFHVLKVLERKLPLTASADAAAQVTQTRARHILLRTNRQVSQAEAVAQVARWREQIVAGQVSFEQLARQHSQDASSKSGGDLGWANPGVYVPEFESAMDALAINGLSEPVVSRFGVHLIQVMERRQVTLGLRERRDAARPKVREQLLERAYADWARDLRARAYVEYREPPQ